MRRTSRLSVCTILALAAGSTGAHAQQAAITPIPGLAPVFNSPNSSPVGVNNAGHFAGMTNIYGGYDSSTNTAYPGVVHSFLATAPASAIDLGVLGTDPPPFNFPRPELFTTHINTLDQISGYGSDVSAFGVVYATTWLPSGAYGFPAGLVRLPSLSPPTNIDRAWGMNDNGLIVGETRDASNNIRPALWTLQNGAATVIDVAPGIGPNGRAYAVNNLGQVVGQLNEPNPIPFNNFFQAFLYLPTPAYGLPAGVNILQAPGVDTANNLGFPNCISDSGQVFGRTAGFNWRPALWLPQPALNLPAGVSIFSGQVFSDETFIRLGSVGLDSAEFRAANSSGVAVGYGLFQRWITFPRPRIVLDSHAFVWRNGRFQLLEDFLPLNSPWTRIYDATSINDSGVIAALALDPSGNTVAIKLTLDAPPCPSGITRQPQDVSGCAGDTLALTVIVNGGGGGDLSYVWRHNGEPLSDGPSEGGGMIQGSGTLQLQIVGAGALDAGQYDAQVTNTCGTLTSTTATVSMSAAPRFTTQPAGARVCSTASATFAAGVDDPSAGFDWQIEDPSAPGSFLFISDGPNTIGTVGFDAAGASTASLVLSNFTGISGPFTGNLVAEAFNSCGATQSDTVGLTVAPCCTADFNNDGSPTVADIFAFLSAWFAGDPRADVNHAGGLTVQDIFDFLSAWFAGCT